MTKTYQVEIQGMTCESCERMVSRCVSKIDGTEVLSVSAKDGRMSVRAPEGSGERLRQAIEEAGYRMVSVEKKTEDAGSRKETEKISYPAVPSAGEVWRGIMGSSIEWLPERTLLTHATGTLTALLVLLAFMYFGLWRELPGFFAAQMPLLLLGAVAVVSVVATGYHFSAYKRTISCSIGMMEGMTFGMMTGFMIGALIGATNGMFWGSVLGMLVGCAAGVWAGWRSGVMGVMEGLMAGVMSGTMGAMLSVMLLASPLIEFLALLTALCVLILIALAYMQVNEMGKLDHKSADVGTFASMASSSVIFFLLLTIVMVYGPKLGPVWGG
ncbi:Uncharacterised protein [uncultured archaeon]|nr:Uncharacterised protein [uncultured archaeon]